MKTIIEKIVSCWGAEKQEPAEKIVTKLVRNGIASLVPAEFYNAWKWGLIPPREDIEKVGFTTPELRLAYMKGERAKHIQTERIHGSDEYKQQKEERARIKARLALKKAESIAAAKKKQEEEREAKKLKPLISPEEFRDASLEERAKMLRLVGGSIKEQCSYFSVSSGTICRARAYFDGAQNDPSLFAPEDLQ